MSRGAAPHRGSEGAGPRYRLPALGTGGDSAHGSVIGLVPIEDSSPAPLPPARRPSRAGSSSSPAPPPAPQHSGPRRAASPGSPEPQGGEGPPAPPPPPPRAPRAPLPPRPPPGSALLPPPPRPELPRTRRGAGGRHISARAGGGPRTRCAPGVVAAAPGSAPRARLGDGFSAAAMAAPSPPPPPVPSPRIPAASLRRLQPRRGQSCRVLRPRGKLLRLRCGFLRAQRVFVSGRTWKGDSASPIPATPPPPSLRFPRGRHLGERSRHLSVCPSSPTPTPWGGWFRFWVDEIFGETNPAAPTTQLPPLLPGEGER